MVPISVGIALLATVLVVPRPIEPDAIPLPQIDRVEQRRATRAEQERADAAVQSPLPYDVRAVGELVRRYGATTAVQRDGSGELATLRDAVPRAVQSAGTEALLRLRAIQTRLFTDALSAWSLGGAPSDDLTELGGDFLVRAAHNGWIGTNRRVVATPDERAVLFRLRWTELLGLRERSPFRPSLDDWRSYYRFLIQHPEAGATSDAVADARRRLGYVEALARRDSTYLADLARGALYFRVGDYSAAAQSLRSHLDAHPDGAWALRARNYLAGALQHDTASGGD